jgi:hypothetical protein
LDPVGYQSADYCVPKALKKEPRWFLQFGQPTSLDYLQKWAQDYKFEQTLAPKIDRAIEEWNAAQPVEEIKPVIIEHEIDPVLQTEESQLLGGAMEINSPWLER